MICGDCPYFISYRNFTGEDTATIVTMGCKLLDNEKDYNRTDGDKVATTAFKDCPLLDIQSKINTKCGSHCFLYHGSGHIQSCKTLCGKEMSCKDVVNSIDCNFCDIPYMILDDVKCRCVANLKWWKPVKPVRRTCK